MKGDFTRDTFRKNKHYRKVNMQQGRVQVDADWNEQNEIQFHYEKEYLKDLIGKNGTLAKNNGFAISASGSEFLIGAGHYYVDGILCENESTVEYAKQPDVLEKSAFANAPYLAYLDVWERHITHLDDLYIREQALGDVDTATRTKIVWQVRTINASKIVSDKCKIWENALKEIDQPTTGTLQARAKPSPESVDKCSLYETAGYTRLENQLYRIEVHDAGNLNKATFKWSRENGAVVSRIAKFESNNKLVIEKRGKDDQLDFKKHGWIEIIDDFNELHGTPGVFVQLDDVEDMTITYNPNTIRPAGKSINETVYPLSRNPKIRRWESIKDNPLIDSNTSKDPEGYIELEDGVQVKLSSGNYRTGDYWLVPARARKGMVEWPTDSANKPVALGPAGILHHYAPLALLERKNNKFEEKIEDLRSFFSSLTELISIHYAGGDGQQALPNNKLSAPLRVSVTLGDRPINKTPMSGAKVKFTIVKQSPSNLGSLRALPGGVPLTIPVNVTTNAEGIAECEWTLGNNMENQQVKAELYDECGKVDIPPVYFKATLPLSFYYIEGDGVEGPGGETVQLRAGIALGTQPISANYRVKFSMREGVDTLSSHEEAPVAGVVQVTMTISGAKQQAMAELLYSENDSAPFLPANLPPIYFNVCLLRGSVANTGIAILKLPREFKTPLIFGPFYHKLPDLKTPPSIYLGLPWRRLPDELIFFMEDFPYPLSFKPIWVSTTQFFIIIAARGKDTTGSLAAIRKFSESRFAGESSITTSLATGGALAKRVEIRWWAMPAEDTGEQERDPWVPPTVLLDKERYTARDAVVITATNLLLAEDPGQTSVSVLLKAVGDFEGIKLDLKKKDDTSKSFEGTFTFETVDDTGVTIRFGRNRRLVPGLRSGGQFQVIYEYEPGKTVSDTATVHHIVL